MTLVKLLSKLDPKAALQFCNLDQLQCVWFIYIIGYRTRMEEFKTLNAEYANGAAVCHRETLKFTHLMYIYMQRNGLYVPYLVMQDACLCDLCE